MEEYGEVGNHALSRGGWYARVGPTLIGVLLQARNASRVFHGHFGRHAAKNEPGQRQDCHHPKGQGSPPAALVPKSRAAEERKKAGD